MKNCVLPAILLLSLLGGVGAHGQPRNPAYVPPHERAPTTPPGPSPFPAPAPEAHLLPGRYQTLDGLWHAARINDWRHDRVLLRDEGDEQRQLLGPETLRRFVREADPDTVVSVRDFVLPGHRLERAVFARQLLRGGGLALYEYNRLEKRNLWELMLFPHAGRFLLLRQGAGPVLALPRARRRLRALLTEIMAEDPVSVARLRAHPPRLWRDTGPLLRDYLARWLLSRL